MTKTVNEQPVFSAGARLPRLQAARLGTDTAGNIIAIGASGIMAPNTSVAATAVGTTATLAGQNVTIPAGQSPGTSVTISALLTSTGVLQGLTPAVRFGTTGAVTDAAVLTANLTAGLLTAGAARITATFTLLTGTSAVADLSCQATGGITGSSFQFAANTSPATVSTAATSYLGLWFTSTALSAVTVRTVRFEVH